MTETPKTLIFSLIFFVFLTRIAIPPFLGHPPNFSAIDAMALFCGAYCSRRSMACLFVLLSVWTGDLFLNKLMLGHWDLFYPGFYWQYASYCLITLIGTTLKERIKPLRLAYACLSAATLFFVMSNLGVWASGTLYPLTFNGLIACYVTAIPFFKNTLLSDLFFTMTIFGGVAGLRGSSLSFNLHKS